jgi:hypothetical protein
MVFPGVLRGRPGPRLATIHTSQPRRSLSSPWMRTRSSVAAVYAMPHTRARWASSTRPMGIVVLRISRTTPPAAIEPSTHRLDNRARKQHPTFHRLGAQGGPRSLNEVDAVPGRFEEPPAGRPESLPSIGGAASHLGGLALCGSGSASSSNVRFSSSSVKSVRALSPHIPKKAFAMTRRRLIRRRL